MVGGLLAIGAGPALAVQLHPFESEFTGADTPAGFIGNAGRIDITSASGDVYVADTGRNRVYRFNSAGVFQSQLTGFDLSGFWSGVAVDNSGTSSDGDLVVNEEGHNVSVYDNSGTLQFTIDPSTVPGGSLGDNCGVAVGGDGSIYLADGNNQLINKFDSAGNFVSQITGLGFSPCPIDVAPDGTIYAVSQFDSVHKLSNTGTPISTFDPGQFISSVTVDDATGHVFVDNFGSVNEYDSSDNLVSSTSSHLEGSSNGAVSDPVSGKLYATANPGSGARVIIFGPLQTFPTVTTGSADNVTDTTASIHGTINPDGVAASYQFEYGFDTSYGNVAPAAPVDAGSGSSDVPANADLTNLQPGTTYHYRLDGTNANGTNNGDDATFTTFAAPTITGVHALDVATSTAKLGATLSAGFDPNAKYHFEFGTTPAYGSSIPAPPGDLGDNNDPEDVSVLLSGLSPNTTYHYKVVVDNLIGAVESGDKTFTTYGPAGSGTLPDGRAYEKVSPADKNGGDLLNGATVASDNGNRVSYMSFEAFAGSPGGGLVDMYFASRGPNGWSSNGVSPVQAPNNSLNSSLYQHVKDDVTQGLVLNGNPPLDGAAPDTTNLYRFDGSNYNLVTPNEPFSGGGLNVSMTFDGASTDYSHIIFEQSDALTNDAVAGVRTIYDFTGGALQIVSRDEAGAPNTTDASTSTLRTAVSQDGTRVFFGRDQEVWVRRNLSATDHVSADKRSTPDPDGTAGKTFWGATPDGSDAYFTSAQKLTDDATSSILSSTSDLYQYDVGSGTLTDVSVDGADPNGADVQSVLGAGAGPTVYFVARGVLDSGATAGQNNLYAARGGTTKFIATLDPGFSDNINWDPNEIARMSRTTANGRYLLFSTVAPQPGFDNNGHREFYRYDYDADTLACVSCNPSGTAPTQDAALTSPQPFLQIMGVNVRRNLLEDGTAYFISPDQLVAGDTNKKYDVYQWKNGSTQLISTGHSGNDSEFAGASANGSDVFFLTRQQLVGSDTDNEVDVYDARVGGGFPEQSTPPACQGDACRGPVSSPPNSSDASTSTFTGVSNKEATGNLGFRVASIKSAAQKKFAKTGKLTISVTVNDAAAIEAKMTAKIGKRARVMGLKTAQPGRAGTVKLTFTLTKAARTELRKKKKLPVTITVSVVDAGSKRATMTLRSK